MKLFKKEETVLEILFKKVSTLNKSCKGTITIVNNEIKEIIENKKLTEQEYKEKMNRLTKRLDTLSELKSKKIDKYNEELKTINKEIDVHTVII